MFKFRKGSTVPFAEKISEGYEVRGNNIFANVPSDKIGAILTDFIAMHDEPIFFILELPTNQRDEEEIQNGEVKRCHKDVYYIDGCSKEEALSVLDEAGELLIDDGMCSFGFGCHYSNDEIMFEKYNVTTVFSRDVEKLYVLFEEHGINRVEDLVTAWETFSDDHPGISKIVKTSGRDVYSIPEAFKGRGMYFAERREED